MKKSIKILVAVLVALAVVAVAAFASYTADFYRADAAAVLALESDEKVETRYISDDIVAFCPDTAEKGIIFYPGGKVEYTAYAPLLEALAQEGVLTVVVKMPFNLAVMDINAADGIQQHFPEINNWYMAGHSLGGSMAASYIADNAQKYQGLILLASYSTADLTDSSLKVLSIYGSEDKVLNLESYNENYINLPQNTTEVIIEDGCHAYFGSYGEQDGDGTAKITPEQQIEITVQAVLDWIA